MQSDVSGHWTDDQLMAHLYGVGPEDGHLPGCGACEARLAAMESHRFTLERTFQQAELSPEFLATQRREIYTKLTYAKLAQLAHWWSGAALRRWASAAAMLFVLGGGLTVYEEYHRQELLKDQVSDAELAEQVSSMSQVSEPQPTAPLKALFEE